MADMCRRRACVIIIAPNTDKKLRLDLYDDGPGRSGEDNSSNNVIGADIDCFRVNTLHKNNRSTVPETYYEEG